MWKLVRYILWTVVAGALGVMAYVALRQTDDEDIEVKKGRINDIETLARLCSTDIYAEIPVLDTINGKVLFAIQKQRGSVTFDIENLTVDESGDTVIIILPPEVVEIYESTEPDSWQVVDTKAIGPLAMLRSDRVNIREENQLKEKIRQKAIRRYYDNGTIARARVHAARTIESMLSRIYRRPVTVIDPTPATPAPQK